MSGFVTSAVATWLSRLIVTSGGDGVYVASPKLNPSTGSGSRVSFVSLTLQVVPTRTG